MKKYIQLSLILVALTCFLLMAVYERKYHKIRILLDVLNAYRIDANASYFETSSEQLKTTLSLHEKESALSPHWSEVAFGIHIYSAFFVNNSNFISGPHVRVLTLIQGKISSELNCLIYSEDQKTPFFTAAHVITLLETSDGVKGTFLLAMCPVQENVAKPYAVSLLTHKADFSFGSIQVIKPKTSQKKQHVACVEPLRVAFDDVFLLIENIVYYHSIGMDHFILYEQGVSDRINKVLVESQKNISVEVLPWNFPFASKELADVSFFTDCLYRSAFLFNDTFIFKLNLKQFLRLKNFKSLSDMLQVENTDRTPINTPVYSFKTHIFCDEFADDIVAKTLLFPFITQRKFLRIATEETPRVTLVFHILLVWLTENLSTLKLASEQTGILSHEVSSNVAVLHTYEKCDLLFPDRLLNNKVEDKIMLKLKNLFFKSQLYKIITDSL